MLKINLCLAALLASVFCAFSGNALAGNPPADGFTYDLILIERMETGQVVDMPGFPMTDANSCWYAKDRVQIGRKIPRGTLIDANGRSYAGIIIGARCDERYRKMGE